MMSGRRSCRAWNSGLLAAAYLSIVCAPETAFAAEAAIDAAPMHGKKIRLDGMLREWPERAALSQVISGAGAKGDPKATAVVGYDDDALYVAMDVQDAQFLPGKDYAELRLSFPLHGGGFKSYVVRLEPGEPGKTAGSVQLGGRVRRDAQLVEAPSTGGFSFEAKIPWSNFPEAATTRVGLRGALVYNDADGNSKIVIGTSKQQGGSAPQLTIESEYALNHELVGAKGLGGRPEREAIGNLVGDKMKERVAVYDRYLTVTGYGYRGGSEFFYQDLHARKVRLLRLVDFNGDGFDEVVVVREQGSSGSEQELLEVWKFPTETGGPVLLFQHEVGLTSGDNRVQNEVEIATFKGKPALVVSVARGDVDSKTWNGVPAGGETKPVLLPWHSVTSRTYAWKSAGLEQVDEKSGKPSADAPPTKGTRFFSSSTPPPGYGGSTKTKADASDETPEADAPGDAPPKARPPKPEELMDQVYELYRAERGAKKLKPRFDFVTDVAADEGLERVVVHGKDIVVFGEKFLQGRSYAYTTIGVEKPEDVLQVTTTDITGDGRAEVVVYGVIRAQASKKLGGDQVTRHGLFVYRVMESGITRVFAAETGRAVGDHLVLGGVKFVPAGAAMRIELHPGRAVGWTEQSYPFPEDRGPYGGLEPLLLPWTQQSPRSYRYVDGKFVQQ